MESKMYYISDFCRICLEHDKSTIKVTEEDPEGAVILSKLSLCVSEVEWSSNKRLLVCKPCVQNLNSAYDFKQRCIKSIETIRKIYVELSEASETKLVKSKLNVSLSKGDISEELLNEYSKLPKEGAKTTANAVPEQKVFSPLTKLIVTNSGQGPFQNFYLNLIPTGMLNFGKTVIQPQNSKQNTQNMIIMGNINNSASYVTTQFRPPINNSVGDTNLSHILNASKSEELSIEVDPTVFECSNDGEPDVHESAAREAVDNNEEDWDDIISSNKISHGKLPDTPKVGTPPVCSFVHRSDKSFHPDKENDRSEITNEEKMEFFNFGHFLTNPKPAVKLCYTDMQCDICMKCFDTVRSVRSHIKQVHNGNFPYKCNSCLAEFALRAHYESHILKHSEDHSDTLVHNSITLENINEQISENLMNPEVPSKEYKCDVCDRRFITSQGLSRHKVKRHDGQKNSTKYFVKGVKNAKCHICNRGFSTQSYLQLHLKIHKRRGEWKEIVEEPKEATAQEAVSEEGVVQSSPDRESENKMTVDEECEARDDLSGTDLKADNSGRITDTLNNNPCEDTRGLKIRINLKNIRKVDESVDENMEEDSNQSDLMEEDEEDFKVSAEDYVVAKADVSPENSCVDEVFSDDNPDHQDGKDEAFYLPEGIVPLQNQNTNVFKFEWVNGKPKCVYCQKMFGRKHDLKRHVNNVHVKSIQYECHVCRRKFYEGFHLTRHLRGHYSSLACPQCNKTFCSVTDVKNHIIVSHDSVGNIDCGVCNISFDDLGILKEHIEEHMKAIIYKCHLCDDEYRECRDLTKHIVEHSGVYTCSRCNRNFCTEKELLSHLRIHSSEEDVRHRCDVCQSTFKKKRYLHSHLKNCHSILADCM